MHQYRSHTCGELRQEHAGKPTRLSGWIHRIRDHGGLLFVDLRDHYGVTQCVIDQKSPLFDTISKLRLESVVTFDGAVAYRPSNTVNSRLPTGDIEVHVDRCDVISTADPLPFPVNSEENYPEETRLRFRYLDLRRERMHRNTLLRSHIISYLRARMIEQGFAEFQTPILTASSPEGARDFLVPSRLHPGKFFALPQAPQIFKQMLMVAGFDRYFQIAPCFRDEDGRADRSPTEFYQLDFEMSFVTQDDVFAAIEPVLHGVFEAFGQGRPVTKGPFPRIAYDEAMIKYGIDKPDLRNPIEIADVTKLFDGGKFQAFAGLVAKGGVVRAIPAPKAGQQPRKFFDAYNDWARTEGSPGLGYIVFETAAAKGPIAKFLDDGQLAELRSVTKSADGDAVFFVCDSNPRVAAKLAGKVRIKLGQDLELVRNDRFELCWIVDFPMYELDDEGKIEFSHNPFSMPQGGLEALNTKSPLEVKAYQYDIVCNGYELSSGAIRNHLPETMYRAFEIAGYSRADVEEKFGGLLNAFKFGAPPHGGSAPGIDRIVMLLADEPNLREVTAFPPTQQAEDLLMNAPAVVPAARLHELGISVKPPKARPSES
jgi:aspartyl-tRNA synthetase